MALVGLRNLCTPAHVYLVISLVAIAIVGIQNMGNGNEYCVGSLSCNTSNKITIFLLKIVYVLVWTWILNMLCGNGMEYVSWVLVLLPFVLFFIMISFMFISYIPDDGRYTNINTWAFF